MQGVTFFFFFSLQILWFLGWLLFRFSFLLPSFLFFFFFFFSYFPVSITMDVFSLGLYS